MPDLATPTPITDAARKAVSGRISVGYIDPATGNRWSMPLDGGTVAGMLQPVLDAMEQLEVQLAKLEGN